MKQFLIVLFALFMFAFAKVCCEKTPAAAADRRQNSTTSRDSYSHNDTVPENE